MLPGSGVARQRILVSYLVIFWHILSYFHITVRNWRPQHINYDTKRVLANELETKHFNLILEHFHQKSVLLIFLKFRHKGVRNAKSQKDGFS